MGRGRSLLPLSDYMPRQASCSISRICSFTINFFTGHSSFLYISVKIVRMASMLQVLVPDELVL